MADNTALLPGGGGDTMRDIDRAGAGIKTQVVQLDIGGAAGNAEVLVTGALPISAASLPLPTGASTAAKQPAFGTAGTPSADVLTVQGVTSMTALKVDGSGVTQPVSGTVTTSPPSNASTNIAQVGGSALSEGQKAMAASVPVVIASDQSAVPVSGTVTTTPPANASTNVAQFGGANVSTGTGVGGAGIPRVTVSSDSFPATQPVSGSVSVSNFPATQPVSGTVTANQGSPPWTVKPDGTVWTLNGTSANVALTNATLAVTQSGTWTVQQGTPPWSDNITQFGGTNISTGTGIGGAGIPRVTVSSDSFPATQPVSAASLPLPAGAATSALQTTINTTLGTPAQEGGNLLLAGYALRTLLDIQTQILAELRTLNLQMANISGLDISASTFLNEQILQ